MDGRDNLPPGRRAGVLHVDLDDLAAALGLPDDHYIVRAKIDSEDCGGGVDHLQLVIVGPRMNRRASGERIAHYRLEDFREMGLVK